MVFHPDSFTHLSLILHTITTGSFRKKNPLHVSFQICIALFRLTMWYMTAWNAVKKLLSV